MTLQDQIEELEAQIASLEARQRRCRHLWGDVKYDPIVVEAHRAPDWYGPIREGRPALPDA